MKIYKLSFLLLSFMAFIAGCKKYAIIPSLKDPAYIRVFNDLNNPVDVFHSQQAAPFLTFLMDPKTDGAGIPNDAAVIGDALGTRQLFSLSYPINEANSSTGGQLIGYVNGSYILEPPVLYPVNHEYPGNAPVLSASFINGFDLSAWAQAPSGKHRIMFVVRPQNAVGFKDLSTAQRGNILLDTTVNFEKGEVYTLEVISRDLDNNKYGLYIRQEQFIHQSFQADKVYVGFTNLSGKTPIAGQYGSGFFFWDKININYSYNILNDAISNATYFSYNPYLGYDNNYYTTLNTKMDTDIPYLTLPLLPESSFFYQALIRTYSPVPLNNPANYQGSLPYFSFALSNADSPVSNPNTFPVETFRLDCSADPNTINNYDTRNSSVTNYTPNLNLVVNTGNTYHVYGTLNIMEIVYDRVYLMQVQRGFNEIPKN
ncbi:hypothetical protein SAMN05216490_1561 [Mucilaginibacter mallensis]|uniref:Uncharacterized protein n=2 Tax=Mucilaginibacter mallensis TaxID=652787 RepID=A0A1H1U0K9_MUCMA|nr:hypothetical protein SAMN05216490_1561 [Mucilaginibacter mallensis]